MYALWLSELHISVTNPTISVAVTYTELPMTRTLSKVSVYILMQLILKAAPLGVDHDRALQYSDMSALKSGGIR